MRQFFRSRWVWLTALLVFTGVLIFASWDRGIAIDYDGTGYLCTVPDAGTAAEIPVSFHGTFRRGTYTGSCDIPGVLSCAALRAQFHGGTADSLFVVDDSGFWVATNMSGLTVTGGLKTYTLGSFISSVCIFVLALIGALVIPL